MKIVVRTPNWVGDAVMALPALGSLARGLPDAEVWIAAPPWASDLFAGDDLGGRVVELRPQRTLGDLRRNAAALKAHRFDAGLLLTNSFASALLFRRAGIPVRWGYRRDGRGLLLTKSVVRKDGGRVVHMVRYYLDLSEGLGFPAFPPEIRLRPSPGARARAEELLSAAGIDPARPVVILNAGAGFGPAKRWPADRFARLGRMLQNRKNAALVLTGGLEDAAVAEAISALLPRPPANLVGKTSLGDLVGVISRASLFVTNDSGPMHIANALRVPIVAVFGPTDPAVTAPFHPPALVLKKEAACWPCFYRTCPFDHRCMTSISAEEVSAAAEEFLG
jgi:heptosyltransferase-2